MALSLSAGYGGYRELCGVLPRKSAGGRCLETRCSTYQRSPNSANDSASRPATMIDEAHVDECQRFLHARGDELLGLTLVRDARGMLGFVLESHLAILA